MTDIAPFRGIRYDPDAVGDLARVVAPPYDVIGDAARDALEAASPHNIVRLTLGRDDPGDDEKSNKYTRARGLLEAWRAAGVLREDPAEALYVYEQRYALGAERRVQRGILASVSLGESGGPLPHERTYDHIVADRLDLLRETEVDLEPIFCVYDGQDAAGAAAIDRAASGEPLARLTTPDDGIEHVVWSMTEPADIAALAHAVARATVVIADGHHRHRTSQLYAAERRETEGPGPWDAQLMFLVDASRAGPSLLPIHRTVSGFEPDAALERLRPVFRIEPAPGDPEAIAAELAKRRIYGRCFAMLAADSAWWLTVSDRVAEREALPADRSPAWRDLDVSVLHHLVFDAVLGGVDATFAHSATEAFEPVERGEATLAFLLAPMPFDAVRAVAEAGEAMPQKSTYFVPKPRTGLVLRSLEPG